MLTTAPHLYIRRPSPTTAEFTVTTCPPLNLPLRLLFLLIHLARLLLAAAAVLTLYARFLFDPAAIPNQPNSPRPNTPSGQPDTLNGAGVDEALTHLRAGQIPLFLTTLLTSAHLSPAGLTLAHFTAPLPDWALALAGMTVLYATLVRFRSLHTTESVLVLRGLGIQICRMIGGGGGRETRFIPTEKIRDVLINEAFRGFEVRYYLVVVVEGEEDVVVLFPGLLPRRKIVEAVWRGVRGCLEEGSTSTGQGSTGKGSQGKGSQGKGKGG
ncbi:phosphatidylinositol N-acetylglucosaminyltransferase subunit gpi15 [Dichotomopilus funicola]|uniref:Phosphatidylinositol N-acetylglucosaminyltransferase subunit gpi15 n=1 Tax=Dichotomopilus funicola TaxID=1934379 RepID=A0AAN6V1A2_9PEZI|nr:phosphatidylinositol N-acetylglucosaminyltransferase subunit gpi15 [Dichotomopilus funicola]